VVRSFVVLDKRHKTNIVTFQIIGPGLDSGLGH
jgi:hypothetical protein